jgi:TonB family protein
MLPAAIRPLPAEVPRMSVPHTLRQLGIVLALSLVTVLSVAQTDKPEKSDKPLTDAERAKRDAERVFNFIRFQTVRPAAAPAKPAAAARGPAATSPAGTSVAAAPAPGADPVPAPPPAPVTRSLTGSNSAEPTVSTADLPDVPIVREGNVPLVAPPAPVIEAQEVPLKLTAYTAPELTPQVLAAMPGNEVVVPVRFTVQTDGRVSAAQALGSGPRRVQQAAVRAVQQWRFSPIPAVREVDVDIAFRSE